MTSGCSIAEGMLRGAGLRESCRLKPMRKPSLIPDVMCRTRALSGWARRAASHADKFNGVDTLLSGGHTVASGGRQRSRHMRSAVYG